MNTTSPQSIPSPHALAIEEIDLSKPEIFQQDAHWGYFERLRREQPVHYCRESRYGPYWSITRFDDIMYVDRHHKIFSSEGGITLGAPVSVPQEKLIDTSSFIDMDPPRHDALRATVQPTVEPRNLKTMEGTIRERAGRILDSLPENESFNWVDLVSIELTTQMLATLFDFPFAERRKLTRWSDVATGGVASGIVEDHDQRIKELLECLHYFTELWNERVKRPLANDLISMLAHGDSSRNLTPMEYLGNLLLLIVGGNDTTRNSISGGVLALNEFPGEYAKLRANQALIPNMVSEIIRWQTPLNYMRRTAVATTELGGKCINVGDAVLMWYASGNRDESIFDNANDFSIERANARRHLSFGFGIHRCMGNRLAEMQLRVLWEEIMKRFRYVEVVGEPKRTYSAFVRGYTELPVRVHRWR